LDFRNPSEGYMQHKARDVASAFGNGGRVTVASTATPEHVFFALRRARAGGAVSP